MAKDPAFLFYSGDFSTGTQFFTDEQVGKYIRLLMAQHQHGHLTKKQVLQITKVFDEEIMSKFSIDKDGGYFNERLDNEIIRRKNYSLSRSKNRTNTSKTYDKHMETETKNKNKFKKPTLEDVKNYCNERKNSIDPEKWLNHYESNGWKVGKNSMKDWKAAVRTWEKSDFNKNPPKTTKRPIELL